MEREMESKKIEKWANLLLDTGKRNNLINFRDTKASTVEIVVPDPDKLFEKVESSAAFEVFDPEIEDDEDEDYRDVNDQENEDESANPWHRLDRKDLSRHIARR